MTPEKTPKIGTPRATRGLRVVSIDQDGDGEAARSLAPLRLIGAPGRTQAPDIDLAPLVPAGDTWLLTADLKPEERRELQRIVLEVARVPERVETTCRTAQAVAASARATLLAFASRSAPPALVTAGRLLRDHGDAARRVLWATWAPTWPVARARLDELLQCAGVPAAGVYNDCDGNGR